MIQLDLFAIFDDAVLLYYHTQRAVDQRSTQTSKNLPHDGSFECIYFDWLLCVLTHRHVVRLDGIAAHAGRLFHAGLHDVSHALRKTPGSHKRNSTEKQRSMQLNKMPSSAHMRKGSDTCYISLYSSSSARLRQRAGKRLQKSRNEKRGLPAKTSTTPLYIQQQQTAAPFLV